MVQLDFERNVKQVLSDRLATIGIGHFLGDGSGGLRPFLEELGRGLPSYQVAS